MANKSGRNGTTRERGVTRATRAGRADERVAGRAEVRTRDGRTLGKNVMQFSLYRKFGADATITFDTPDAIPEDQLKEQSAPGTAAPGTGKRQ